MKLVQHCLTLVLVYLSVVYFELTLPTLFFELAKSLPTFEFKPLPLYKVGDRTCEPTTKNIVEANGYPFESHLVETEDGYILEVHRIPYSKRSPLRSRKIPVILQHGNIQSSVDWLINSPANHSLGFFLADSGYDVWMPNQRGNVYSTRHVKYPLGSHDFWNFSFHEMGKYDVPAVLDYVTKVTGQPKVHYVSYSIGTTTFFIALALRPEYNSKIALGVTLGPSVFEDRFWDGIFQRVAFTSNYGNSLLRIFGAFPLISSSFASLLHVVLPRVCNPTYDLLGVCMTFIHVMFGNDDGAISKEQLPLIASTTPSSTGYKTFNHVVQLVGNARFAEYDYGEEVNMEMYNRPTPPDYNLTNVNAPISIIVGRNDKWSHPLDAKKLGEHLGNLKDFFVAPFEHFAHLHFCYGRDKAFSVYHHVLELMDSF